MKKNQFKLFTSFGLILFCSWLACTNMESKYEEGRAAYNQADYATALRILAPLAEKDHTFAQMHMAFMHARGWGTAKNYEECFKWLTRAAKKEPLAQWMVGKSIFNGHGTEKNEAQAMEWIRKAAAKDIQEAKRVVEHYQATGTYPYWLYDPPRQKQ